MALIITHFQLNIHSKSLVMDNAKISEVAKARTFTKLIFINTKPLTWNTNYKAYLIPVFRSRNLMQKESYIAIVVLFIWKALKQSLKSSNNVFGSKHWVAIQNKMCLKVSEKSQENTCTGFSSCRLITCSRFSDLKKLQTSGLAS